MPENTLPQTLSSGRPVGRQEVGSIEEPPSLKEFAEQGQSGFQSQGFESLFLPWDLKKGGLKQPKKLSYMTYVCDLFLKFLYLGLRASCCFLSLWLDQSVETKLLKESTAGTFMDSKTM